jgi:hypothetical protein
MKQHYSKYDIWEDYGNGMYDSVSQDEEKRLTDLAIFTLSNTDEFSKACKLVSVEWPESYLVNMTNRSCNRRAWLGQASCSIIHGCNDISVRKAWAMISDQQRIEANQIADKIISSYEYNYERKDTSIY